MRRHSELHSLMLTQAERSLQRRWRPRSTTERVVAMLRDRPPARLPSMACAARGLGWSVRSLRRRLDEEGTSYRALTQEMTHEAACLMLRNQSLTLQTIAHTLGFTGPTAFYRAFRRWTGHSPSAYAEQLGRVASGTGPPSARP